MDLELDCEAHVVAGMSEALLDYLASPRGRSDLECAKAMHRTRLARMKEVLKAYSLARVYAAIYAHHPTEPLRAMPDRLEGKREPDQESGRIHHRHFDL
jgi:hypothetical protein